MDAEAGGDAPSAPIRDIEAATTYGFPKPIAYAVSSWVNVNAIPSIRGNKPSRGASSSRSFAAQVR